MKAIGDNLLTVARSARYTDAAFRALFRWAVGDLPDPPAGYEAVAELIEADQRLIEERAKARKEKAKERKARWNAKNARNAENAENAENDPILPSIHPKDDMCITTRTSAGAGERKPPTLADVLRWAGDAIHKPDGKAIPEEFCRKWVSIMEAGDPPWTNTRGRSVLTNWRQALLYAWNTEKQFAAKAAGRTGAGASRSNQPDGVIHHEANYENPLQR